MTNDHDPVWPDLHLVRCVNMKLYTHVPSSGRRASTGSVDGQTTWTVGGTETERHHAAGPAPKSATHRHTAMQQLTCYPALDRQKQHADKQEKRDSIARRGRGRERERESTAPVVSRNPLGRSWKYDPTMTSYLHVRFLMCWCVPTLPPNEMVQTQWNRLKVMYQYLCVCVWEGMISR